MKNNNSSFLSSFLIKSSIKILNKITFNIIDYVI